MVDSSVFVFTGGLFGYPSREPDWCAVSRNQHGGYFCECQPVVRFFFPSWWITWTFCVIQVNLLRKTPKKSAELLEFDGSFRSELLVKLGNAGILHVDTSPATPFAWVENVENETSTLSQILKKRMWDNMNCRRFSCLLHESILSDLFEVSRIYAYLKSFLSRPFVASQTFNESVVWKWVHFNHQTH